MANSTSTVLTNARLYVGTGEEVIPNGALWIDGDEIRWQGPAGDLPAVPDDATRIDCGGRFVMPGLVESHAHLSYGGAIQLADLDLKCPPEETFLTAMENAALMLRMGYTSACSFGSLHRTDVALRNAINAGRIPGPRYLAAGRDITPSSGLVDWNPSYLKLGMEGLGFISNSPWEVRRAVREIRKEGADNVKIYMDGENLTPQSGPQDVTMSFEEVMAAAEEVRARNVRLVTHSRCAEAVKMALKAGADVIGHANYLDDEAIDMMRKSSKPVYVTPGMAFSMGAYERGAEFGLDAAFLDSIGYRAEIEITKHSVRRMREAGVKILPGGDYGFAWTPHGTWAKDLQYFVELFNYTPFDALLTATRDAGEMVGFGGGRVGTLEAGKLADLVVIDGDPTADVTVLQDAAKIVAVMKGGEFYHNTITGQVKHRLPVRVPASVADDRPVVGN
ncbi:MAG TPA: amidohydrolase family protein [Dehalococcoidia bacterium]|nr:amidohydrolase family protein [Dehalococcoidia bacterium]